MILTAQGFQRKSYEDYLGELERQARELFGADVNLGDASPLGQWIKLIAYQRAEENELAEAVYNSAFVDTATGIGLDRAVKYKGITRFEALAAKGQITMQVDPGVTVEAGLIVATDDDKQFITTETATDADLDGVVTAEIEAIVTGMAGNVPANTITDIATPSAGVLEVNNEKPTDYGRDKETDAELRNRYYATTGEGSTTEGIKSALLNNVPALRGACVIENNLDDYDADGRPPHSFEAIVLGGNPMDIGQVILNKKPAGIRAIGSQEVVVKDSSNRDQIINFSYANAKNIYAKIDIITNSSFQVDGFDIIKSRIIEYIDSLSMGDSVIYNRILILVFGVAGVEDATITLSTDNVNYAAVNVDIGPTDVAQTSADKLVVSNG